MIYEEAAYPESRRTNFGIYASALLAPQFENYSNGVLKFMIAMEQFPRKLGELVPAEDFVLANKLIFGKDGEATEFQDALAAFEKFQSYENMVAMVDGACDLIYVVIWAMFKFNIPLDKCFAAVQRANMAKLVDGKPLKYPEGHELAGKVRKPDGWVPPEATLLQILVEHFDLAEWQGNMRTGDRHCG